MSARALLVVGALAIAGIVVWLSVRDDDRGTPTPDSLTPASRAPIAAPASPSIPGPPAPPASETPSLPVEAPPPAEQVFAAEPRDERWAAPTEREITRRFAQLRGGRLAGVECRRAQCRLVLTGSETELADTIADLEGPRGMHGFAKNVLLTAPAKRDDGSIELRAYLLFERPE